MSCSEEFSSFNNTPKAISFSIQNVARQYNSLIKYFFFFYSQFFVTKYRFFPLHASSVNHQGRYILFVYYFLTFTYKKGGQWPHWETAMIFVYLLKKLTCFAEDKIEFFVGCSLWIFAILSPKRINLSEDKFLKVTNHVFIIRNTVSC